MLGGGCAQAVQMLTQMGFPADGVFDALRATNNDADEACTWLMESAAEADMSMGESELELACPTVSCRRNVADAAARCPQRRPRPGTRR